MKVLIGAAAAAVVLTAAPAFAQTSMSPNCTGFEAAPTQLPDGATADRGAIETATERVQAWATARHAKIEACEADIQAMIAARDTAVQGYQATTAAWSVEVNEFNARSTSSSSNRRERGSTLTRPNRQ